MVNRPPRIVFVANTPAEERVRTLKKGDEMTVLGIPRLDLAVVSWRTRNAATHPEALTWNLPYEIIVVGLYGANDARKPAADSFLLPRTLFGYRGTSAAAGWKSAA
jgi:hypothetical protein